MNSPIWPQLALVLAGGLIALIGGLAAAWLTARLTERRQQRELLHRLHELYGRHQAIVSDASDQTAEPIRGKSTEAIFGRKNASPEQVAFMIGFLEKISAQTEGYISRTFDFDLKASSLRDEKGRLEAELAELQARGGDPKSPAS